jgi:hypothetical protein
MADQIKVFIHKVTDGTTYKISPEEDPEIAPRSSIPGLYFFTTYKQLAAVFQDLHILSPENVEQISNAYDKAVSSANFKPPTPGIASELGSQMLPLTKTSLRLIGGKTKKRAQKKKHNKKTHKKHKKVKRNKKYSKKK